MHFVLQTPSLQHLAGVKIVVVSWNRPEVLTQIVQVYSEVRENRKDWKAMEEKVKLRVSALPLPQLVKKQLFDLLTPVGVEIIRWCRYHYSGLTNSEVLYTLLLNRVRWTMHGTVNYAKTAEVMVKDERVNLCKRYEFACINCLEEEAKELFQLLPEERRREYANGTRSFTSMNLAMICMMEPSDLIVFFTRTLSGHARNFDSYFDRPNTMRGDSIYKYLFKLTLILGNCATCEYLFEKLNPEEKDQVLEDSRYLVFSCEFSGAFGLLYYLSRMNGEQQERMFRECTDEILMRLLHWPVQSLFVETAKRGWSYMSERSCKETLYRILRQFGNGYKDYDYARLFWECWGLTPADCKQRCLSERVCFSLLIKTEKEELIKLAFMEAALHLYQILALFDENDKIKVLQDGEIMRVLMDESVISDLVLLGYKDEAASNSLKNERDEEKRLRSQHVSQLVNIVMEKRGVKRRDIV